MNEFEVKQIKNLITIDLDSLIKESKDNGFRSLERLMTDYKDGTNTFNKTGEFLYGVYSNQGVLIAIGGLNIDPFSGDPTIGRLRRFYVANDHRRNGIGTLLLNEIISEAKRYYRVLVLRTDTVNADKFYRAFGFFKDCKYPNSTHYLNL